MLNWFASLRVKVRIGLGLAAVLLLLLFVGGAGISGMMSSGEGFDAFAALSQNTVRVAVADRNITSMRRNTLAYVLSGADKDAARFRELAADVKKDLAVAHDVAISPERKAKLETAARLAADYAAGFVFWYGCERTESGPSTKKCCRSVPN